MVLIINLFLAVAVLSVPGTAEATDQQAEAISSEDYALYDHVVTSKFLTSETQLVVIERMTRFRLSPDQEGPPPIDNFLEQGYFAGGLSTDLIRAFISVNRQPSRLEGRFHFAVGYRFTTEGRLEEPEVSLSPYGLGLARFFSAPVPIRGVAGQAPPQASEPVPWARARPGQAPSILDHLAFSRVARSPRNDHALLYVEVLRPDGTGAGFLVWCRRQGRSWTLFDTEVAWTIQAQEETEEGPLLAP
ncbi:MAG: hypothetical protein HOP32_01900 [Nitrospira sp.]|nr:hypothetical protein [Nitrospira sp.]